MNRLRSTQIACVTILTGLTWMGASLPTPFTPVAVTAAKPVTTISEGQIRKILKDAETASNQRNLDAILKYMAPNITINMTVKFGGQSQQLQLNREQYRQYAQQSFETTRNYNGKFSNLKVQLAPNRKSGTATYRIVEQMTLVIGNQPIAVTGDSNVRTQFALVNGQIMATAMTATTTMQTQ